MRISVAICTWNRAKLLDKTLCEFHSLHIPEGVTWELLVVNNNCTDSTDDVIARHADRLPLRRLFEPKPGHSNARNCAVAAAAGDLIIWTDDDVLVDPEWLASYVSAARRWPDAGYFGGLISPWYEITPPDWVVANLTRLYGMLVIRDLGEEERPFSGIEQPFGANMAFRTDLLRHHRFDPELGYKGTDIVLGDETALLESLRSSSIQGVWVPSARVRHYVGSRRLTRSFLWSYFRGEGVTAARMRGVPEDYLKGPTWRGVPRWLRRLTFGLWLEAHYDRLLGRPSWLEKYIRAAHVSGIMREIRDRKMLDGPRVPERPREAELTP